MTKNKKNLRFKTENLLSFSASFMILVLALGSLNYVENNDYKLTKALADEESNTIPESPGGGDLGIPTAPSTNNTTTNTNSNSSASSSTSSNTSTNSTSTPASESPTDGKTPASLPGGESDVIVIGADNKIESNTSATQINIPVQTPATSIQSNVATGITVRSGGLEVTLASLAVLVLVGYFYYYKKHVHTKGNLKTAEKKINSK